jgi:very-short-patch-repair endonuclease
LNDVPSPSGEGQGWGTKPVQDAHLIDRATQLRNASTPFESLLWRRISRSQLGAKFRRQHVIGNCIVDFFCPAKGLIIEIDGDTHDTGKDAVRDRRHARLGYATVRFTNAEVGKNIAGVIETLAARLTELPNRWPGSTAQPHPNPSPKGEGK